MAAPKKTYRQGVEGAMRDLMKRGVSRTSLAKCMSEIRKAFPDSKELEKKTEAIGIRALSKKSPFYKKIGLRFDSTRAYLVEGDVVVVLATSSAYSYVRYANPDLTSGGRVTTGWVRSADLVNPFPSAGK